MKPSHTDYDAHQVSALAADSAEDRTRAAAATRRSRRLRLLAIVVIIVAALAAIVGPHFLDPTRISSVADRAAADAGGGNSLVRCPDEPLARGAVNPTGGVGLTAAVVCHYVPGSAGTPPVQGQVPTSQLADLSADMNAHTVPGPLTMAPGLQVRHQQTEAWVIVGLTSTGDRVQLIGRPYPSTYAWDGLGPGLIWSPSPPIQQMLAADLPR